MKPSCELLAESLPARFNESIGENNKGGDDVELLVWSQSDSSGPRVDLTAVKLDNEFPVTQSPQLPIPLALWLKFAAKMLRPLIFFSHQLRTGLGLLVAPGYCLPGGGGRLDSAGVGNVELENWKLISKISRLGVKSFIIMDQIYHSQGRD